MGGGLTRRGFLARVGLGAGGAVAAPFAVLAPKVDPILRALLDKGALIVERPEWATTSLWRAEIVLDEAVVGYISKASGAVQLCTSMWPAFK
jgi:hypothetical protein